MDQRTKPGETIYQVLDRIETEAELAISADASPLDFLCAVYRSPTQPEHRRMRAAIEAAPYMHPKLSVTLVGTGKDFAAQLEQAIRRSGKMIEHMAQPDESFKK